MGFSFISLQLLIPVQSCRRVRAGGWPFRGGVGRFSCSFGARYRKEPKEQKLPETVLSSAETFTRQIVDNQTATPIGLLFLNDYSPRLALKHSSLWGGGGGVILFSKKLAVTFNLLI